MAKKNYDLMKTSINLPSKLYKRIESFADSVCINRNAAMIYLLARGLDFEVDFEHYMSRKQKRKLDPDYVQNAVETSIRIRMNDKAKQRLERDERVAIYHTIMYDDTLRNMILEYARSRTEEDIKKLVSDTQEKAEKVRRGEL